MSTVLLVGVGPLPCYRSNTLYGFGVRAWQFLLPLLADGHRVILATFEFSQSADPVKIAYRHSPTLWGDVTHVPTPEPNAENRNDLLARLHQLISGYKPTAIVSAGSTISSSLACSLSTDLPIWVDLFGDLFAEVQAKTPFAGSDQLDFFHRLYLPILRRGDVFSTVSEPQKFATIGQLGIIGRLDHYTLGCDFVHTIPCAIDGTISLVHRRKVMRGKILSDSPSTRSGHRDFVVLLSGGFNTWADIQTLFSGLDAAMNENPCIHVVVTGGAIAGHHEEGFNRFQSFVRESRNRDRYHIVGWVPTEDVDAYVVESNLGLNVDLEITESLLGSRNRFLSWMQAGLPILTTVVCELSRTLYSNRLCLGVPPGNPDQLSQAILYACEHEAERREMAERARRYAYEHFTFDATTVPLREWLKAPRPAPDRLARRETGGWLHPLDERIASWLSPGRTGRSTLAGTLSRISRRVLTRRE